LRFNFKLATILKRMICSLLVLLSADSGFSPALKDLRPTFGFAGDCDSLISSLPVQFLFTSFSSHAGPLHTFTEIIVHLRFRLSIWRLISVAMIAYGFVPTDSIGSS
jgi:hypothetical protein